MRKALTAAAKPTRLAEALIFFLITHLQGPIDFCLAKSIPEESRAHLWVPPAPIV